MKPAKWSGWLCKITQHCTVHKQMIGKLCKNRQPHQPRHWFVVQCSQLHGTIKQFQNSKLSKNITLVTDGVLMICSTRSTINHVFYQVQAIYNFHIWHNTPQFTFIFCSFSFKCSFNMFIPWGLAGYTFLEGWFSEPQ